MQTQYSWRCFVCEASNEAGTEHCLSCGFPAIARGREIAAAQRARQASETDAPPPLPISEGPWYAALIALPWHRRLLAAFGGFLAFAGAIGLKAVPESLEQLAWFLGAMVLGGVFWSVSVSGLDSTSVDT